MENTFTKFKALHNAEEPLLIANVWDVTSARVFEKLKYKALATSSAAVAETLGYKDGEEMSFDEYLFVINRIARSTSLPFSVDLESGYGNTDEQVIENIQRLSAAGVVGINIEDSVLENGTRKIADALAFTNRLKRIASGLRKLNSQVFINVRCDTFLLGLTSALDESKERARLYSTAEIDGLFFPCIMAASDIQSVTQSSSLPVSVMCMPGLPGFDELKLFGVSRISMGNFVHKHLFVDLEQTGKQILQDRNFKSVFNA